MGNIVASDASSNVGVQTVSDTFSGAEEERASLARLDHFDLRTFRAGSQEAPFGCRADGISCNADRCTESPSASPGIVGSGGFSRPYATYFVGDAGEVARMEAILHRLLLVLDAFDAQTSPRRVHSAVDRLERLRAQSAAELGLLVAAVTDRALEDVANARHYAELLAGLHARPSESELPTPGLPAPRLPETPTSTPVPVTTVPGTPVPVPGTTVLGTPVRGTIVLGTPVPGTPVPKSPVTIGWTLLNELQDRFEKVLGYAEQSEEEAWAKEMRPIVVLLGHVYVLGMVPNRAILDITLSLIGKQGPLPEPAWSRMDCACCLLRAVHQAMEKLALGRRLLEEVQVRLQELACLPAVEGDQARWEAQVLAWELALLLGREDDPPCLD